MADILQTILQFLNVNCQYIANNCYYQNPFEGIFYLVLLPAAILIAFLYILFSEVLKIGHMGIRLILTMVVFIFIILQGWFSIFISIGPLWVMIILVIAIFITVFGRWKRGRGQGGGGGQMPGPIKYGFQKLKKGGGSTGAEKEVDSAISSLNAVAADYMGAADRDEQGLLAEQYRAALKDAIDAAKSLEKSAGGGEFGEAMAKPYFDRITAIQKSVERRKVA